MRQLRKWAWTAVIAVVAASPAAAQQGGITSGGRTTTGTGMTSGSSGLGSSSGIGLGGNSGSGGQGGIGGQGGNSGQGGNNSSSSNNGLANLQQQNSQYTNIGSGGSSSLQKSNVFASFYANPYAMGLSSSGGGSGGFGQPLFGATSGSGASARGAGGLGGAGGGGFGGGRGAQNASNQSGILIPLQVQMTYSATMQFPTPPVAVNRIQSDLRVVLDNTSQIANPKNVQIITDANNNVTLRGTVKDNDEARLVEGLVRLTPGVGGITNELTATASASPGK